MSAPKVNYFNHYKLFRFKWSTKFKDSDEKSMTLNRRVEVKLLDNF